MRKYLRKRENGVYYIAEGYNEQQMVADGFAVYAVCAKQDIEKLEGYNIVGTPGELIGKGGGLWSRHTPACIAEMVG